MCSSRYSTVCSIMCTWTSICVVLGIVQYVVLCVHGPLYV